MTEADRNVKVCGRTEVGRPTCDLTDVAERAFRGAPLDGVSRRRSTTVDDGRPSAVEQNLGVQPLACPLHRVAARHSAQELNMKGLNRAFFIGPVAADPEVRSTAGGLAVVRFAIGTPVARKVEGGWEEETHWHKVVAFGKDGEFLARYAHKGDPVAVECAIRQNRWTDKDGKVHFDTSFVVERICWLGRKASRVATAGGEAREEAPLPPPPSDPPAVADSEIPF